MSCKNTCKCTVACSRFVHRYHTCTPPPHVRIWFVHINRTKRAAWSCRSSKLQLIDSFSSSPAVISFSSAVPRGTIRTLFRSEMSFWPFKLLLFVERFVAVWRPLSITWNSFVIFPPANKKKKISYYLFLLLFFNLLTLICLWVDFAGTSVTSLSDLHDIRVCMQTVWTWA